MNSGNRISWDAAQRVAQQLAPEIATSSSVVISSANGWVVKFSGAKRDYIFKLSPAPHDFDVGPTPQYTQIQTELYTLARLGDTYAARIRGVLVTEELSAEVLKWTPGRSLSSHLGGALSGAQSAEVMVLYEGARAILHSLHSKDCIHGDIQPSHVRISNPSQDAWPELIDFGLAGPSGTKFGGGMIHFLSPTAAETLLRDGHIIRKDAIDRFALAASFATALTGGWVYDYSSRGLTDSQLKPGNRSAKLRAIALGPPISAIEALQESGLAEIANDLEEMA